MYEPGVFSLIFAPSHLKPPFEMTPGQSHFFSSLKHKWRRNDLAKPARAAAHSCLSGRVDEKWVSVFFPGAELSPALSVPGAAIPDLLLLIASVPRADTANLKPSTFQILTHVKPGEQGGQGSSDGLEN